MNRLCDENCNECSLLFDTPSNRMLTLTLARANAKFGDEFYTLVQHQCPNLTCCVECNVDDFVHVEGCSILQILEDDVQSSNQKVKTDDYF